MRRLRFALGSCILATKIDFLVSTGSNAGLRDLTQEADLAGTCESCLAKGGGWCTSEQRCVEDDIEHCDAESLIGLAGFTNDCNADQERHKPAVRNWIDKDVLVLYTYENGTCCMGMGIVHRAYHVLEEYTVLLRDGSREEVKTDLGTDGSQQRERMKHRNITTWSLGILGLTS